MKQLLITIAALVLVGCGPKTPNISIDDAARDDDVDNEIMDTTSLNYVITKRKYDAKQL